MYGVAEISRYPLTGDLPWYAVVNAVALAGHLRRRRRLADGQGHGPGVTTLPAMSEQRTPPNQMARFGPLFAGVWLFFLLDPLLAGWRHRDEVGGDRRHARDDRVRRRLHGALDPDARGPGPARRVVPPLRFTAPYLGALAVLAVVMVVSLGETGLASIVYIAVACVMVLPLRVAAADRPRS